MLATLIDPNRCKLRPKLIAKIALQLKTMLNIASPPKAAAPEPGSYPHPHSGPPPPYHPPGAYPQGNSRPSPAQIPVQGFPACIPLQVPWFVVPWFILVSSSSTFLQLCFLVHRLVERDELITSWRHPGAWHAVCILYPS
jgi:hypothetical protein